MNIAKKKKEEKCAQVSTNTRRDEGYIYMPNYTIRNVVLKDKYKY